MFFCLPVYDIVLNVVSKLFFHYVLYTIYSLLSFIQNCALSLQIGFKGEWRGHQGRVILFLGNKHVGALSHVRAVILPPAHLRMQLSPVPDTIPPRAQVKHASIPHLF